MDRDKELENFQRELEKDIRSADPYLHKPDQLKVQDGETCWLDQARICGADCMAYNTLGVGLEPEQEVQGHLRCVVLASQAGNFVTIARLSASLRKTDETLAKLLRAVTPYNPNVPV